MKINESRLLQNLHTLKTFTDTPGEGVTRFSYGKQDARAREYILSRAEKAGCSIDIDALQNIRIGLKSNVAGRPAVLAGSHIDTVRNGGWLDGIYGVCSALEVLETFSEAGDDFCPHNNYEVAIFAEEEGSGFGSTMTGSKFIAGIYKEENLDSLVGDDGRTLRQVLSGLLPLGESGTRIYCTEKTAGDRAMWDFGSIKSMLELHIEQGPVLDRENLTIGIVESIFGMRVIEVTLTGVGNHAGATPMGERRDALCAAAECILAAEKTGNADPEKRTVATVGKMMLLPNCSNVIPETVKFSLEVRDRDEAKIDGTMNRIVGEIEKITEARNVACEIREHSQSSPLRLSDRLIRSMSQMARRQDLAYRLMDSGAVHDACMIANHVDTGMIFVPSIDGRSHVPEENTREADLVTGAQFLLDVVKAELE